MTTITIGNEYDLATREALLAVLVSMGADVGPAQRAIAGSQEVERYEVLIRGERLVVEIETYEGIAITGSESLTAEVSRRVVEYGSQNENKV